MINVAVRLSMPNNNVPVLRDYYNLMSRGAVTSLTQVLEVQLNQVCATFGEGSSYVIDSIETTPELI